ncbi:MAG: DoxX family membrane protein [bacterium]
MSALFWIGRIIFGLYFIFNGVNHFAQMKMMSGYAASKGVPLPSVAVIVTGLLLLAGGLSVLTNYLVQWGLWALVIFLIPTTLWMHSFWGIQDQMQRMGEMVNFLKNFALLGAVFILIYFYHTHGSGK